MFFSIVCRTYRSWRLSGFLDTDIWQNLARQRAAKFGEEDSIDASDPFLKSKEHTHILRSTPDYILSEIPHHIKLDNEEDEEANSRDQPRGFFADQFEVCLPPIAVSTSSCAQNGHARIEAILMLTSRAQALKFGDRQMVG